MGHRLWIGRKRAVWVIPIKPPPDIMVVPSIPFLMPPMRVFAENAFGCLQKQKLSLISKNPAARSLVDGKLNKRLTPTHMKIAILTLIAASAVLSACQQPAPPPPPPPMQTGK